MDLDHRKVLLFFSVIFIFIAGCSFDIVQEENSSSLTLQPDVDIDPLDPFDPEPDSDSGNDPTVVMSKYLGSCYEATRSRDEDEYCIDLESETELNPDELIAGQAVAEEFCNQDSDLSYVTERCVNLNNQVNKFKPVVDNNVQEKLCDDRINLVNLRVKAFHVLADDQRGRLEYDQQDRECERRRR